MPTPALRATSSRDAAVPCSANASPAHSRSVSRLRFASARSARSAASGVVTARMPGLLALMSEPRKNDLPTGGSLRIVTGGALRFIHHPPRRLGMPVQPPTSRTAGSIAVSPQSNPQRRNLAGSRRRNNLAGSRRRNNLAGSSPGNRRSAALAIILLAQLMVVLDATIVNIALPKIQTALSFSRTDLSWVLNAYSLTFGGLLLLGARSGDLFGRRRVFLAGIALFTVASLAGGFTTSSGLLLLARSIQGVGAAFASPSALALLMITFREGAERTRAIALYTAVSIGGSAVGLVMGGVLVEFVSWRWVFFVNVPIGIVLLVLARRDLPETDRHTGRVDVPGALTSTIGMAALVYGFVQAAASGWQAGSTI